MSNSSKLLRATAWGPSCPKVVPKRVEFRPRYFKRGALTRRGLDYLYEHPGQPITVSDSLPRAVGDRTLSARDQEILRVTIHQAMHKLAKRGVIERPAPLGRIVRWQISLSTKVREEGAA